MGGSPSLASVERRSNAAMIACNVIAGAAVSFVYYRLAPSQNTPWFAGEDAPFAWPYTVPAIAVAGWVVVCVLVGYLVGARDRQIKHWYTRIQEGVPASEVPERVRRYVLERPLFTGMVNLGFWMGASALFGGVLLRSAHVALMIFCVAGVLSVALGLALLDLTWRPIVPVFLPEGRVTDVPALRLSVLARLLIAFLAVGVYPATLVAVASVHRASSLAGASGGDPALGDFVATVIALVAVAVPFSVLMACAVTRAISEPLGRLRSTMSQAADDLSVRVPVTTNDELGYLGERFNEMAASLQKSKGLQDLLDLYVSNEVAREALESGGAIEPQVVECTVLFCDLRGFTELVRHDSPQVLVRTLTDYMTAVVGAVVRHGGIVNKFGGDSVLALYGTPLNPQSDPAAQAVRTAIELRREIEELSRARVDEGGSRLRIGVGIATGQLVAGSIGGRERIEYTVIGQPANLADRLQRLAKQTQRGVLIDEPSHALASGEPPFTGEWAERLDLDVDGESVTAYGVS